jgi:hypothetical protein
VHRHAGHGDGLAGRLAAAGQGDVEQLRGAARVVVEQLVEIPHAVEQQVSGCAALMRRYCCIMGVWDGLAEGRDIGGKSTQCGRGG